MRMNWTNPWMVGALSLALTTACADDVVDGGDGLADDGETGGVDPGPDQGLEGIPAEGGIVVTRVEFNQGVGVDVARDGAWLDGPQRIANIVRDRKAIVRAFWDVPADFSPRPIEARLHLRYLDGTQVVKPFTLDVSGPSEPEELATGAFGWILEPAEMAAGMEFRVTLWEQGEGPETTTPVEATEGWSLVGTEDDPAEMKAVLVPVVYMNDQGCSTDMRELTEAQVQGFAQALADQNPTQKVTVTMREEPIFRPNTINDPSNFFSTLQGLRIEDNADPNVYYYAIYDDCGGAAGTLGAAPGDNVPPTKEASPGRVAAGRWFSPGQAPVTWGTFVHEVGHTQSFAHAPCGADGNMPASPDPSYPYGGGIIGIWGINTRTLQGYGPDSAFDYMGYCDPSWVSDYRWRKAYEQIRILTSWDYESSVEVPTPPRHLLQGLIYEDGTQEWWTTLGAPTPGREFVDSSVDLQVEGGGALRLDATVWEVEDAGQQVRMVAAALPDSVTHLSQIEILDLLTEGELWTPSALELNDAVSH